MPAVALLAACGGPLANPTSPTPRSASSAAPTSSTVFANSQPAGSVRVLMAQLRFKPSNLEAKAGTAVFYLVVPSTDPLPHNMVIEHPDGSVLAMSATVRPGQNAVFTVDNLAAGNYKVISSLDGIGYSAMDVQADAGMVGTLTVTA